MKRAIVGIAAVAAILGVGGESRAQSAGNQLTIAASGGTFQDALTRHFYQRFEKATGARIVHVPVESAEQFTRARAMNQVGRIEWDLVSPEPQNIERDAALLERLDCGRIPNAAKLGVPGACSEYGVFRGIGGGVLTYNTKLYKEAPSTWADFWNVQKFPGPRCLPGGLPHFVTATALLADGVPSDKLFPMDINRAVKKLEQLKPNIGVWWSSGNQSMDTLRKGECAMSWMWSGRALQLVAEGQPITITWKQHQPVLAYWGILKGAPNKELAYKFLDFWMTEPSAHVAFTKEIFYDTASAEALKTMSNDELFFHATAEVNRKEQVPFDWKWVADNTDRMRLAIQDLLTR